MSKDAALYQSLAACGAAVIMFIGVCHEFVGHTLFPWGPDLMGGPIGWHGLGIFVIGAGCLVLGGTLRLIKFPVVPFAPPRGGSRSCAGYFCRGCASPIPHVRAGICSGRGCHSVLPSQSHRPANILQRNGKARRKAVR